MLRGLDLFLLLLPRPAGRPRAAAAVHTCACNFPVFRQLPSTNQKGSRMIKKKKLPTNRCCCGVEICARISVGRREVIGGVAVRCSCAGYLAGLLKVWHAVGSTDDTTVFGRSHVYVKGIAASVVSGRGGGRKRSCFSEPLVAGVSGWRLRRWMGVF